MASYLISYDLPEGSEYGEVIKTIKSYGTWAHITESTWAIVSDDSAIQIRDRLQSVMPRGSRLLVVLSGNEGAWVNVMSRDAWLKEYL